jgi:hypothetical protein
LESAVVDERDSPTGSPQPQWSRWSEGSLSEESESELSDPVSLRTPSRSPSPFYDSEDGAAGEAEGEVEVEREEQAAEEEEEVEEDARRPWPWI